MSAEGGQDKLSNYERLVATIPGVERKGKTMPYTSVNGNMGSYLPKSGRLALKPKATTRQKTIDLRDVPYLVLVQRRPQRCAGLGTDNAVR